METKGRDSSFKCSICGKFIAYDDIPDKVKVDFTPDTEYTVETISFTHLRCYIKKNKNIQPWNKLIYKE